MTDVSYDTIKALLSTAHLIDKRHVCQYNIGGMRYANTEKERVYHGNKRNVDDDDPMFEKDVKPATGCTEPIALSYASAVAAKYLGEPIERIEAQVSANLMKMAWPSRFPAQVRQVFTSLHLSAP